MNARWAVAALLPLCLCACVMFEHAPADLACDPQLAGTWVGETAGANSGSPGATLVLHIDGYCRVRQTTMAMDKGEDASQKQAAYMALGFVHDGEHYLALSMQDLQTMQGDAPDPSRIDPATRQWKYLLRYRIEGDDAVLFLPATAHVLQQIKAKDLPGAVQTGEPGFQSGVVTGTPEQLGALLSSRPDLFEAAGDANPRFHRTSKESRP